MFESKYSKILTIVLIIIIIAIIILLGFLGYDLVTKYIAESEAGDFVESFSSSTNTTGNSDNNTSDNDVTFEEDKVDLSTNSTTTDSSTSNTVQYNGFDVVGTMEIPQISFSYPILATANNKALEVSVGMLYGVGINEPGNTVISGHNYRNGLFFSNNKKLDIGDKIYVTDNSGNKLTYTIYDKFETTKEDVSFYERDTNNIPEITLTTCNDDSSMRLIILAKAE